MAVVVVTFDVHEIDGARDARILVKFPRIGPQILQIRQAAQIALEMADIHGIEPDERCEKPPVGFMIRSPQRKRRSPS